MQTNFVQSGFFYLRSRIDGELELALLAVVNGESLHEEGSEAGARAATE